MSHPNDSSSPETAIPVLDEVIVQGDPAQARDIPELSDVVPEEPAFVTPAAAQSPHVQPAAAASAPAPASAAPVAPDYDADLLAERLRGRFASFLTGEGRTLIEARCRDTFQEHTTWLVNQITREVALALETEVAGWIREAIREELKQRGDGAA
ncbi:DUF2486 family protein [Paraburkholderia solisilvae]|uniref:DUF2486 domain-containing protein n=1 Tax=Paraburkholderia solisilvae TaxID=624376 RepID=A0A6J5DM81_9BURK|nr:DUF2486 family protein [Paraburkholderia solisilvae]CAB3755168.1 hypothetical protein LMG29739_02118 [Paraburkholderia solisilvae]